MGRAKGVRRRRAEGVRPLDATFQLQSLVESKDLGPVLLYFDRSVNDSTCAHANLAPASIQVAGQAETLADRPKYCRTAQNNVRQRKNNGG